MKGPWKNGKRLILRSWEGSYYQTEDDRILDDRGYELSIEEEDSVRCEAFGLKSSLTYHG